MASAGSLTWGDSCSALAAPVAVVGAAAALLTPALGALSALLALSAAAFFVFDVAGPDTTRSLELVMDVSERASSRTRGLAGGISAEFGGVKGS